MPSSRMTQWVPLCIGPSGNKRLLLQRYSGAPLMRVHEGPIAVERSDQRYCSDGFGTSCDNGERTFRLRCGVTGNVN